MNIKESIILLCILLLNGCGPNSNEMKKIIFLHHSTGQSVWVGKTNKYLYRLTGKGDVQRYIDKYNKEKKTNYFIKEQVFPKSSPYGWSNYPYDYYNIWVKNGGQDYYMEEPTLELLTKEYDVIIFKHCYPVSLIQADISSPDADSDIKSVENYQSQYAALKTKMHEFHGTRFILWTPAVNTKHLMTEEEAVRTRQFRDWIVNEWDEKGDNIFVWDFYELETEGGLYLKDKNALSPVNSHPGKLFAGEAALLFGKFITDVIAGEIE